MAHPFKVCDVSLSKQRIGVKSTLILLQITYVLMWTDMPCVSCSQCMKQGERVARVLYDNGGYNVSDDLDFHRSDCLISSHLFVFFSWSMPTVHRQRAKRTAKNRQTNSLSSFRHLVLSVRFNFFFSMFSTESAGQQEDDMDALIDQGRNYR